MQNIDTNLYSRQIRTYGIEIMKKLQNLKILIIGLRGLGIEVAKNLILAGPKEVKIYDPNKCTINDLGSNFYLSEKDIGKKRDISCLKKLSELNPYVLVNICEENFLDHIKDFNAIIITEIMKKEILFKINEECHINNIAFIYAASFGISGFIFVDFGKEHIINFPSSRNKQSYFIKSISKDGIIEIDNELERNNFSLEKGSYIIFKEVEGINELNNSSPKKIKFVSNNSFSIDENLNFENYVKGGIIEEYIFPKKIEFKKLKDIFDIPYIDNEPEIFDYCNEEGRNESLHCAFMAIHEFYDEFNNLPKLNNKEDYENVLEKSKNIYNKAKSNNQKWIEKIENFDEKIIINVARWCRSEISPFCSFLGGIVVQEIIKITGKFIPFNQWFWIDFFESIDNLKENVNRELKNSRYDDQIAIYGQEIQDKLSDLNVFIIGAGALGCELLKIFSLMGISTKENKKTLVTDNDHIEISNLNRQFLFSKKDVNQSKSKIASQEAKKINDKFNCDYLELLVNKENEKIFNEEFWIKQNFILTAVDNAEARRYIDSQCTKYSIPLIDSGTLGTSASSQIIYPFKTSCYNDNPKPIETSIPMCTLHNFPSKIEHCIEWGLAKFNDYFITNISNLKKYLEEPNDFFRIIENEDNESEQIQILKNIIKLISFLKENNYDKIIEYAIDTFCFNFDFQIQKLIKEFPEDTKNKDNTLFWSGSKKMPHPINFDINDSLCFEFIKLFSYFIIKTLNLQINEDINYIKNSINKFKIPKNIENEKEENLNIENLKKILQDNKIESSLNIIPEIFEKDNDSNYQIDFINVCSNLRARNYKIQECDREKTKMIAGKIVPAIVTTTATITGFVCLQLYTLLHTDDISFARSCYLDLSCGTIQKFQPSDKIEKTDEEYDEILLGPSKAVPPGWTVWDNIKIKGPMKCEDFIKYFKENYNVKIMSISSQSNIIIQVFMPSRKEKLPLNIEDIYKKYYGLDEDQKYLWLEITGYIDNVNASMPRIKYIFK